jgi:hypothetical protein
MALRMAMVRKLPGCYLFGQDVVGAARDVDRLCGVRDSLYRRSIQRKDGDANTAGVHAFEAFGLEVQQLATPFWPDLSREILLGITDGIRRGEVLFEDDLVLHG